MWIKLPWKFQFAASSITKAEKIDEEFGCGCCRLCRALIIAEFLQALLTGYALVQSRAWKPRWSHTWVVSVHQVEVQRRLTCLPEPADLSAELSTVSPHFLLVLLGSYQEICFVPNSVEFLIQIIFFQIMVFFQTILNSYWNKWQMTNFCASLNTYQKVLSFLVCSYYQFCGVHIQNAK